MNDVERHLRQRIEQHGPVSVATFFHLAVSGLPTSYYAAREPFGAGGDFITSPEISQVFGECIGAWCVDVWQQLGSPSSFQLVELGPGRGTLMGDVLRASRVRPGFARAARVTLVETSSRLRQVQEKALSRFESASLGWASSAVDVPSGLPTIFISNEFLDALPARQFVRVRGRWLERVVAIDTGDKLVFGVNAETDYASLVPELVRDAAEGSVHEFSEPVVEIGRLAGARLKNDTGAFLAIDYGYKGPSTGDTLQAVRAHARADVLTAPGGCDLTFHVDFDVLGRAFGSAGCAVMPLIDQRDFLFRTGAAERTDMLKRRASEAQAVQLDRALSRLTSPDAMGTLFKVFCASFPSFLKPAGFAS